MPVDLHRKCGRPPPGARMPMGPVAQVCAIHHCTSRESEHQRACFTFKKGHQCTSREVHVTGGLPPRDSPHLEWGANFAGAVSLSRLSLP